MGSSSSQLEEATRSGEPSVLTEPWQTILERGGDAGLSRSSLRSLAAWATARQMSPDSVEEAAFAAWVSESHVTGLAWEALRQIVAEVVASDARPSTRLTNRLLLKAERGTVRGS